RLHFPTRRSSDLEKGPYTWLSSASRSTPARPTRGCRSQAWLWPAGIVDAMFSAWLSSAALSIAWRGCFTENGLINLKIAHREAAKDDLPNARDLIGRGANRGDGDFGCEFYRVPIDPCADAWERKCSK